jgi:hypothetical protein
MFITLCPHHANSLAFQAQVFLGRVPHYSRGPFTALCRLQMRVVQSFMPATSYTAFSYIASQISPTGDCSRGAAACFWTFFGIMIAFCGISAIISRANRDPEVIPKWEKDARALSIAIYGIRVVIAMAVFAALALLTSPGTPWHQTDGQHVGNDRGTLGPVWHAE